MDLSCVPGIQLIKCQTFKTSLKKFLQSFFLLSFFYTAIKSRKGTQGEKVGQFPRVYYACVSIKSQGYAEVHCLAEANLTCPNLS